MRNVELIAERRIPELVGYLQDCDSQGGRPHGADQHQLRKVEAIESPLRLAEPVQNAQPEEEQGKEKGRLKLARIQHWFFSPTLHQQR